MSENETTTLRLHAAEAGIAIAAEALRAGELVAFPTETVYGLGADAASPRAVAKIYAAKGRPSFNPLIAHVLGLEDALREAALPQPALRLAEKFWPGPLTLVVPARPDARVCDLARAGLASVALRAPAHQVARALLEAFGAPVVAPSANVSGRVSPVTAADVLEDLDGRVRVVLDGGRAQAGLESTIVAFLEGAPALLRPGAISREAIEAALGQRLAAPGPTVTAPGQTLAHYAPRARLRLEARTLAPDEAGLDFAGALAAAGGGEGVVLDLSPMGDLVEAAANLFAFLRELDRRGVGRVAVAPIPTQGLGEAINDRLRRAAHRDANSRS
jgi:L-threonylcarbamoyladenylate synthase